MGNPQAKLIVQEMLEKEAFGGKLLQKGIQAAGKYIPKIMGRAARPAGKGILEGLPAQSATGLRAVPGMAKALPGQVASAAKALPGQAGQALNYAKANPLEAAAVAGIGGLNAAVVGSVINDSYRARANPAISGTPAAPAAPAAQNKPMPQGIAGPNNDELMAIMAGLPTTGGTGYPLPAAQNKFMQTGMLGPNYDAQGRNKWDRAGLPTPGRVGTLLPARVRPRGVGTTLPARVRPGGVGTPLSAPSQLGKEAAYADYVKQGGLFGGANARHGLPDWYGAEGWTSNADGEDVYGVHHSLNLSDNAKQLKSALEKIKGLRVSEEGDELRFSHEGSLTDEMQAEIDGAINKQAGFYSELLSGLNPLNMIGGNAIGSLAALATPTRSLEDQAELDTGGTKEVLKDLLIPGLGPYRSMKRLGTSIRGPELKEMKAKRKAKDGDGDGKVNDGTPEEKEAAFRALVLEKIAKRGLWDNVHAKRKRGEKPAKKGDKDYPDEKSWKKTTKEAAIKSLVLEKIAKSPAWQRKAGKNSEGGLNAKGRASYNKSTGGNLKAPVTSKNPKGKAKGRKASFCARMSGMKKKNTSKATASDPNSRINKSLRKWNC